MLYKSFKTATALHLRKIGYEIHSAVFLTYKTTHHAATAKAFNQAPNLYPPLLICNSIYGTAPV